MDTNEKPAVGSQPGVPTSPVNRFDGWVQKFEEWSIFILMGALVLATFAQVVLRNLPGNPSLPWIDLLARLVVLWVGLLGASLAVARNKHINVDIFGRLFPPVARQFVQGAAALMSLTVLLAIVHGAFTFGTATKETTTLPMVQFESLGFSIPETLFTDVLPFLFILMLWHTWVAWRQEASRFKASRIVADVVGAIFLLGLAAVIAVDVTGSDLSSLASSMEQSLGAMVKAHPIVFLGVSIVMASLGAPLYVVLSAVALIGHYGIEDIPIQNFISDGYGGFRKSPIFLAIPLFTLAGFLMAEGKTADRLVGLFRGFLGWLPGGVAIVGLLACSFFTAFTGASGVTIIALGGLLLPILLKDKYPENFTLGLLTTGGSRGLIFPPSIPIFLIAMIMGLSWDAVVATGGFGEAVKPKAETALICQARSDYAKAQLTAESSSRQADKALDDEIERKLAARLAAAEGKKPADGSKPAAEAAPKDEFELGDDPTLDAPEPSGGDGSAGAAPAPAAEPTKEAPKDEFELGDDDTIEVEKEAPAQAKTEPAAAEAPAAPEAPAEGRDEFELGDDPALADAEEKPAAASGEAATQGQAEPAADGEAVANAAEPVEPQLPPILEAEEPLPVPSSSAIFTAGVIPGLLMILAIAIYAIFVGVRRKVVRTPFTIRNALSGLKMARYELPIPLLIGVGIFGGFFTAAEAASATAVYTIIMQMVLYRDFGFKSLVRSLVDSVVLVGGILIILVAAMGMLNFLVVANVPDLILGLIENMVPENLPVFGLFSIPRQITFLLLLNVFLLIVGCLMDIFSATLVVLPLLLPISYRFGIHPAHLAVIFITNLEIGYSTPPVGINLFVASLRFDKPVVKLYAASVAFLAIMFLGLMLITYWPGLSLWLVELTGVQ